MTTGKTMTRQELQEAILKNSPTPGFRDSAGGQFAERSRHWLLDLQDHLVVALDDERTVMDGFLERMRLHHLDQAYVRMADSINKGYSHYDGVLEEIARANAHHQVAGAITGLLDYGFFETSVAVRP